MSLTRQQPRFPGSTVEDRLALYAEILGATHFQAAAATDASPVALGIAREDLEVNEPYVILLAKPALAGPESITVNVQIQRPGDVAPFSILLAPVVLDNASPVGTPIPLPLDPAFDGLLPTGTVVFAQNTVAHASVSPANTTYIPLVPST